MRGNIAIQEEWEALRCGKFTASQISKLFSEPRSKKDKEEGKLSEGALTYIYDKCSEIVTGTIRQLQNWSLEWGNQYEPEAAHILYHKYPDFVYLGKESPKFFKYTDFSGGSPDGYSNEGLIVHEVKCPENPSNHIGYCMVKNSDDLKMSNKDYYLQIQFNMVCVGKEFGHDFKDMRGVFTSYCPIVRKGYRNVHHVEILPDMDFYEKLPTIISNATKKLGEMLNAMSE